MSERIEIIGHGAVGRETAARLTAAGREVIVRQRTAPKRLPPGARFEPLNIAGEPGEVTAALAQAGTVILAVGLPYRGDLWEAVWPRIMANTLAACRSAGARLIFVDNLYMYGAHDGPLTEDLPLTNIGRKPRARATVTKLWQAEKDVRTAAVRPSDFYGADAPTARLASLGIANLARGKPAFLVDPPDMPHDFTYVPDIARAIESLLNAPDDAFGQAWHVPNAPTRTIRQLLQIAADALGVPLRLSGIPAPLAPLVRLLNRDAAELKEMRFQFDRPYHVDHTKSAARFWADATPFEVGVPDVARAYAQGAAA